MHLRRFVPLVGLVTLAACGPDYADGGCTVGPGCGEDAIPPEGVVESPLEGDTVRGVFTARVTATDNIGIAGVDYYMDGVRENVPRDTDPPYQHTYDPTLTGVIPGGTPGPRELAILVFDASGNVDTLELTVTFIPCTPPPAGASRVPCA